jgi:hypothetical protein
MPYLSNKERELFFIPNSIVLSSFDGRGAFIKNFNIIFKILLNPNPNKK